MTLKTGDVLQNRYRVVRLVGQGGFGAVYRAWDVNVSQPVALKENLGVGGEAQRQFEREATLLAGLRHPNLPRVTDQFIISGQGQYLVMDYVEGKSLAALLAERGRPLPEADALAWVRQVCDALTYLHARPSPIIHRDIKPENIIVTADNRAMLVDFGISKVFVAGGQTTVGAMAVTPGFSPPEQYGGGGTDARSDIYALAATLYKLLTGQTPPESVEVMAAEVRVPPAHELNPSVNPTIAEAIARAMTPQMSRRTANAAAFAAELLPRAGASPAPAAAVLAPIAAAERAVAPARPEPAPAASASVPTPVPTPTSAGAPPSAPPRQRSDSGLPTLALLVLGVALSLALYWLAYGPLGNYDYRAQAFVFGLAFTSILLVGALGGPWLGALGGALVGTALHYGVFYWEWPFAAIPLLVGFLAGLRARNWSMRPVVGAALAGLFLAALAMALELGLRYVLRGDSSFNPVEAVYFAAGGVAVGLAAWLVARALPPSLAGRLPTANRLR